MDRKIYYIFYNILYCRVIFSITRKSLMLETKQNNGLADYVLRNRALRDKVNSRSLTKRKLSYKMILRLSCSTVEEL